MKKIVITGALGHIGSQLIRDLASPDLELILVDDLSTQRFCSLFDLPAKGQYRFIEADILNADLTALLRGADSVIHLAAITNAAGSFENAQQVEQVNYVGTERIARACLETGTRLLFPSTTSVYGTQAQVVDENCTPEELKPQSPYADSKLKAEQMIQALGRSEGLKFVICRLGTIFGVSPGMRFHTAINKFCWQANLGIPITVWKTALHQNRPYLDLGDAVRAIGLVLERDLFNSQLYNVVTLNSSVGEIVDQIRIHIPQLQIEFVDTKIMNQLSYNVDASRFKGLGFEFTGNLKRGIEQTLERLKGVRPL